MKAALMLYPYIAPAILAPLSFLLWHAEYGGELRLVATAWLIPVLWAYIVPGIGTNVLGMWEFDTRLKLGRFRVHHGFVFGSATATLAWLVHLRTAQGVADVVVCALVMAFVLGAVNVFYDIKALQAGVLRVYNQPWAEGKPATAIALDYAPWFFGGFGAVYGAGLATMELLQAAGALSTSAFAAAFVTLTALASVVPTAGYMMQSRARYGHWGTRPVPRKCPSV